MLAPFLTESLGTTSARQEDAALVEYDRLRRREFGGKWIVEWIIRAVVGSPRVMNRAARGLAIRKDMGDLLVGVTRDLVPGTAVVHARYLASLFLLPARAPPSAPCL